VKGSEHMATVTMIRTTPTPSSARSWALRENATMRLPRGVATIVRVERGTVLVTQEGDLDDHVLEAGDEHVLRRRGLAVAWALTDAAISLREGSATGVTPGAPGRPVGSSESLARARSLDQFGVEVAHELKNPLTGVKALVQLGLRNPAETASHERLAAVEREVTRMQEILQRHLTPGRPLQEVTPERVELGPLVADTLLALSARADEAEVRLRAGGDATVEADPRRLREALLNLVANGIEATPPGGEVVVEVCRSPGQVELVVRDTGRGMPPETLHRLGTPFFTTREEGAGLGVVLAYSAVVLHGGSLRYESEPGRGTTVRATLPARAAAAAGAGVSAH
jgi:two-component system, NtrC family, sensor histidine kinase HydH